MGSGSGLLDLPGRIQRCRVRHQQQPAWAPEAEPMLALTALVAQQSRGLPLAPPRGPELDRARRTALAFATERRIAEYLDAKGLPRASVAVDTASGFAIVARSQRPLQFIETADPDFTQAVNAPTRHGVRYLLTVPPTGRGEADALNLRYPTLFEDGAGVAARVVDVEFRGHEHVLTLELPDGTAVRARSLPAPAPGSVVTVSLTGPVALVD